MNGIRNKNRLSVLLLATMSIALTLIYSFRGTRMMATLVGSSLQEIFGSDEVTPIRDANVCEIMQSIVIIIALVAEMYFNPDQNTQDRFERVAISLISFVTALLVVCMIYDDMIPVIFVGCHYFQGFGAYVIVTSFNAKLFPQYFNIVPSQILLLLAIIFGFVGLGSPFANPFNILGFVLGIFSFGWYASLLAYWMRAENILSKYFSKTDCLSISETYCLAYSIALWVVILIAGGVTFYHQMEFGTFHKGDVIAFILSFVVFATLVSIIPAQMGAALLRVQKQQTVRAELLVAQEQAVRAELLASKERQIIETKRGFIRYISHEVRSPLGVLLMSIDLMIAEFESGNWDLSDLISLAQSMRLGCNSALKILDETMMVEKIEDGRFEIFPVNLTAVTSVLEIFERMNFWMREKEQILVVKNAVEERLCCRLRTLADSLKIEQVIRNLITNAVKFSSHSATINVVVLFESEAAASAEGAAAPSNRIHPLESSGEGIEQMSLGHLKIEVIDSGPGISEEDATKLFAPFSQFNPGELQAGGGNGLGLWASSEIARLHGGTLSYRPRVNGTGSIFTLSLPCSVGSSSEGSRNNEREQGGGGGDEMAEPWIGIVPFNDVNAVSLEAAALVDCEAGLPLRILVVDDFEMFRQIIIKAIKRHFKAAKMRDPNARSYEIIETDDGNAAVRHIQESMRGEQPAIDLVIMDNIMPHCCGPKAARLMREAQYVGSIIGVTGNLLGEDVRDYLAHGANAVLKKPIPMKQLVKLLNAIAAFKDSNTPSGATRTSADGEAGLLVASDAQAQSNPD